MNADALRPFVDRPVGDLTAARHVAAELAHQLGSGPIALIRVGMNALYSSGDVVIRVGRPSAAPELALALARSLTLAGVAVAAPADDRVVTGDGLAATAWRRVEAVAAPIDWVAVGRAVRAVHRLDPATLPGEYPLPSPAGFPWWHFDEMIAETADDIDPAARDGLALAIERHRGWAEMAAPVVCHGDVHPGNVLMTADGPVLLDWDLMCHADPAWDHAMLLTLADRWGGDPGVYRSFSAGYARSYAGDPSATRFSELRNVAATLMRVRAGRTDPSAKVEAERRLRYWRGDPTAPMWRAQ